MEESAEEAAVRGMLERGVPQLLAPAQRLERVRERVRRRRRRRAAAVGATAALTVAAALVAVPGLVREPHRGRPVAAAPRTAAPAAPTTGAPPTPTATAPPTALAGMAGLRLRMPREWRTLTAPGTDTVYVSPQALALPKGGCVKALDDFCTPLQRVLATGSLLASFQLQHDRDRAAKARQLGRHVIGTTVYQACRQVGGTVQLGVQLADLSGSDVVVNATVCLSRPTAAQQAAVRDVLTTAEFA